MYRSQPPGGNRDNLEGSLVYSFILMAAALGQRDEDTLADTLFLSCTDENLKSKFRILNVNSCPR